MRTRRSTSTALTCGLAFLGLWAAAPATGQAGFPYPKKPQWLAKSISYSTGLALADVNGDGYKDLIFANGNDMARQKVVVYYSRKGYFPLSPDWSSTDVAYNTSLAVGDVNGDGLNDLVVTMGCSKFLLPCEGTEPERSGVKVYLNRPGGLSPVPERISSVLDAFLAVDCALGDIDGDGDLDLAVAVPSEADGSPGALRVYTNEGGHYSPTPWKFSALPSVSVLFTDLDADGMMDLIVGALGLPVFASQWTGEGSAWLSGTPRWLALDWITATIPMFLDAGLLPRPPRAPMSMGVAVSYNDYIFQSTGNNSNSHLEAYPPQGPKPPVWKSSATGYGGGLVLADLDGDGYLDLISNSWGPSKYGSGRPLEIYRGKPPAFATKPAWSSSWDKQSVLMAWDIAVADLDRQALKEAVEVFPILKRQTLVTLSRQVIEEIDQVWRNGRLLAPGEYVSVPGRNWISFRDHLRPGDEVRVEYSYSSQLDIAVANFGVDARTRLGDGGTNCIFYHLPLGQKGGSHDPVLSRGHLQKPKPAKGIRGGPGPGDAAGGAHRPRDRAAEKR